MQVVCSLECAIAQSHDKRAKAQAKAAKVQRSADKATKQRLKSKSKWLKEVQVEFNKFIRARDHLKPCISCGRHHQGQYHAGHYRTDKALRFNEIACFKQCMPCNTHLSGNQVEYRKSLVELLGEPLVTWLDRDHKSQNWTVDELKWLKAYYRQRAKEAREWAQDH